MTDLQQSLFTPAVAAPYDRDEWYTPDWLLLLVRATFGAIDVDPASCATANKVVQATRFYDKEINGLVQHWSGRVWCNPPYSRGNIEAFVDKFILEYDTRRMTRGLLLVNNATETAWFQSLLMRFPVCFLNRRVRFWHSERGGDSPRQGQVVFYAGPDWGSFRDPFSAAGVVVSIGGSYRLGRACHRGAV
jgi:ParB family chromosome partitioning protein